MKCRICNKEFTEKRYCKPNDDICSSECYRINFWKKIEVEKDNHIFIKGESYSIGPENSMFKGFVFSEIKDFFKGYEIYRVKKRVHPLIEVGGEFSLFGYKEFFSFINVKK